MAKFISKIKRKVVGVAKGAKDTTKKYAEKTKLKLDIKLEEANLEECFEKLGMLVYAQTKSDLDNSAKIAEVINEADFINKKIEGMRKRLAALQDKEVCQHCNAIINRDSYCEHCEEKIVVDTTNKESKDNEESKDNSVNTDNNKSNNNIAEE